MAHLIKSGNTIFKSGNVIFGGNAAAGFSVTKVVNIHTTVFTNYGCIGLKCSQKWGCFFIINNINMQIDIYDSLTYQLANSIPMPGLNTTYGNGLAVDEDNDTLYVGLNNAVKVITFSNPLSGALSYSVVKTIALGMSNNPVYLDYYNNMLLIVIVSTGNNVKIISTVNDSVIYFSRPSEDDYYTNCFFNDDGTCILVARNSIIKCDNVPNLTVLSKYAPPSGTTYYRNAVINKGYNRILVGLRVSNNPNRKYAMNYGIFGAPQYINQDFTVDGGDVNVLDNALLVADSAKGALFVLK